MANKKIRNKKIRNATVCKGSSITFKSQLEKTIYNTLIEQGFTPKYEPKRIVLLNFEPCTVPFYDRKLTLNIRRGLRKVGNLQGFSTLKVMYYYQLLILQTFIFNIIIQMFG